MRKRSWIILSCIIVAVVLHLVLIHIDSSRNLGLSFLFEGGNFNKGFFWDNISYSTIIWGVLVLVFVVTWHFTVGRKVKVMLYVRSKKIFDSDDAKSEIVANLILCIAFVLYCAFAVSQIRSKYYTQQEILYVREILDQQKTVIHAAGDVDIDGTPYSYTNSLEAVNSCYNTGNRVAEIDFMMTCDNKLVCAHNGEEEDGVWAAGSAFITAPTETEFKNGKVFGALTPMSLDDLAEFMRSHDDFYVVTDIKDDNYLGCKYIKKHCSDIIDRFIIQIYDSDEYAPIHRLGFKNIIYTLYRVGSDKTQPDILRNNLYKMDLIGITCWDSLKESIVDPLEDIDVLFFVHTVNDKGKMGSFIEQGVLVYTDNTDNDWLR